PGGRLQDQVPSRVRGGAHGFHGLRLERPRGIGEEFHMLATKAYAKALWRGWLKLGPALQRALRPEFGRHRVVDVFLAWGGTLEPAHLALVLAHGLDGILLEQPV